MAADSKGEWRWLYAAFTLGLVGLFLLSIRPVLTPFVLLPAVILAATPWAGSREHTIFVVLCFTLWLLWALEAAGFLLAPFILAFVIAYILSPGVRFLQSRRVPRSAAILLLALPGLVLLVLLVVVGLPALGNQIALLAKDLPSALQRMAEWIEKTRLRVLDVNLPLLPEGFLQRWARAYDPARLEAMLAARQQEIVQHAWATVLGIGKGVGTMLTILSYVILTPILTYYLLRDWPKLTTRTRRLVPRDDDGLVAFAREYDRLLSHYLHGQLLEATFVGVATWVGLWILGFPYAGVVGAVAGVFNLVPYLGLIVSLIPAIVISLLSGSILASLGKVAIVFAIVQFIDGSITGPRIVGGSVGLHPVWVMLALALGSFFFGFVGLLLAVPGAVFVKLLLGAAVERYQRSELYLGSGEPHEPAP